MVTQQQLREHLGRRPFRPFRVVLLSGAPVDVTRTAQAVVTARQLIAGTPDERWRRVPLDQIDRVEVFEVRQPAP